MPKKYIPVQFAPRLYAEWGELLEGCSTEKKAEYLMAIIKFPNIDIPNDPIWNFIKSQLAKDYYNFIETCKANSRNSSNYWADKRKVKEGERSLPPDIPLLTCDNEGEPKQKHITETPTETPTPTPTEKEKEISSFEKLDRFNGNHITLYQNYYKQIFGSNNCYLLQNQRNKITEIAEELGENYEPSLKIVLNRLKTMNWESIGIKPTSAWLLKDDNYIKVYEGMYSGQTESYSPYTYMSER